MPFVSYASPSPKASFQIPKPGPGTPFFSQLFSTGTDHSRGKKSSFSSQSFGGRKVKGNNPGLISGKAPCVVGEVCAKEGQRGPVVVFYTCQLSQENSRDHVKNCLLMAQAQWLKDHLKVLPPANSATLRTKLLPCGTLAAHSPSELWYLCRPSDLF